MIRKTLIVSIALLITAIVVIREAVYFRQRENIKQQISKLDDRIDAATTSFQHDLQVIDGAQWRDLSMAKAGARSRLEVLKIELLELQRRDKMANELSAATNPVFIQYRHVRDSLKTSLASLPPTILR